MDLYNWGILLKMFDTHMLQSCDTHIICKMSDNGLIRVMCDRFYDNFHVLKWGAFS